MPYSPQFYERQQEGSLRSARSVLPHLIEFVKPRSIIDVGCGVGTWLKAALELGVQDIAGLDGAHVERSMLQIPDERFTATDLAKPFRVPRTFDAAMSVEVAEHLPEESATMFVESLALLAPVILFSAAIPKQMGEHHLNEQWQSWWAERFARVRFVALDCIRRRIWDDAQVEWWYAQNVLLMVREDYLNASPVLRQEREKNGPLTVVHPRAYIDRVTAAEQLRPRGPIEWLSIGPSVVAGTLRRMLVRADKV